MSYKKRQGNPQFERGAAMLLHNIALDVAGKRKRAITLINNEQEQCLEEVHTGKKIYYKLMEPSQMEGTSSD